MSLSDSQELLSAKEFFKFRSRVPVVSVTFNEPREGAFLLRRGDRMSFRELLAFFASHFRRPVAARENS
jgi:hypothetical protein